MIQDITYETAFLYFDVPTPPSGSVTSITAYSYDGENYDFDTSGTGGGETSVVFVN
jgi:hypothetical protein